MDIKELEKQRDLLNLEIKKYYTEKTNEVIEKNKKYIGKCYKRVLHNNTTLFIRVISVYDTHRVNVLEFTSCIDLDDGVFNLNDYGFFCNESTYDYIGNWTEISEEEFKKEMDNTYNQLKSFLKID